MRKLTVVVAKLAIAGACCVWAISVVQPVWAAPGDRDPSFGVGGKLASDVTPAFDLLDDATLDADGRIVAVGLAEGLFAAIVTRYLPDGTLDSSFSDDGYATLDDAFGLGLDSPGGVAVQASGRVIVGITTECSPAPSCWVIAGYQVDGDLDPTFGTNGLVVIDPPGNDDWLLDLVIGAGDEIIAVGYARGQRDFAVARLLEGGTLDTTFGGTGFVTTRFTEGPWASAEGVAIDSHGRVVLGGFACRSINTRCRFAAVRYLADGTLDRSFSADGKTLVRFPNKVSARASGVAVTPDDKIYLVGEVFASGRSSMFGTVRLRANGRLDEGFSLDGRIATNFVTGRRDGASSVALQEDGRILVGGFAGGFIVDGRFAVVRFLPVGRRDAAFGGDGKVTTQFDGRALSDRIQTLLVQSDGKLLAAGHASIGDPQHDWNELFGFVRYLTS